MREYIRLGRKRKNKGMSRSEKARLALWTLISEDTSGNTSLGLNQTRGSRVNGKTSEDAMIACKESTMRDEGKTNWPNRGSWSVVKSDSHHNESPMLEAAPQMSRRKGSVAGGSAPPRVISDRVGFVEQRLSMSSYLDRYIKGTLGIRS